MKRFTPIVLGAVVCLVGRAAPARAQQPFESVGLRALGMGGAFVGVANDVTAVYWNPAGLATAGKAGATLAWTQLRPADSSTASAPGQFGRSSTFSSLGGQPAGLSYAKFRDTVVTNGGPSGSDLRTFETSQYGITILQTLTQ